LSGSGGSGRRARARSPRGTGGVVPARSRPPARHAAPPLDATWEKYAAWALGLFRDFLVPGDAAPAVREASSGSSAWAGWRARARGRPAGYGAPASRRPPGAARNGNARGVQVLDAMGRPRPSIPAPRDPRPQRARLSALHPRGSFSPRRGAHPDRDPSRPRLPAKLRGYDEERLLFTLLKESAGERLVLSCRGRTKAGARRCDRRSWRWTEPPSPGRRRNGSPRFPGSSSLARKRRFSNRSRETLRGWRPPPRVRRGRRGPRPPGGIPA